MKMDRAKPRTIRLLDEPGPERSITPTIKPGRQAQSNDRAGYRSGLSFRAAGFRPQLSFASPRNTVPASTRFDNLLPVVLENLRTPARSPPAPPRLAPTGLVPACYLASSDRLPPADAVYIVTPQGIDGEGHGEKHRFQSQAHSSRAPVC